MADVILLVFAIDFVGVWIYTSAALYEVLCRHLLRRAPVGVTALAALVYLGTYCLMLGVLWWLCATETPPIMRESSYEP